MDGDKGWSIHQRVLLLHNRKRAVILTCDDILTEGVDLDSQLSVNGNGS
jgi:hypothetical protein